MALCALLFSHDERVVRLLKVLLAELPIKVEHASDFETAKKCLLQRKYDGVFSECENQDGATLLRMVRRSKHNRRSIAFALSESQVKMSAAFELGAHFVIQKPFVIGKVKRTLRAAHGLMMREQRSHFRHPITSNVSLRVGEGTSFNASLRDLTQSGAMLETGMALKKGQPVQLRFILPDTSVVVETQGSITWSDLNGRAGVHFESLPDVSQQELLQWVVERSMEVEPAAPPKPPQPVAVPAPEVDHEIPMDIEVEVEEPEDPRLRATLRAQHQAPLKVLAFVDGKPVIMQGTCTNVSELGLAAELEDELDIGELVLSLVSFPGVSQPMVLHAEVRHRDRQNYGFEFAALSEKTRDLLRKCLSDLPVD